MTTSAASYSEVGTAQWPGLARTALILFVWLLPFHSLVIALLFGVAGLPMSTARMIAAWKEAAVVALVLAAIYRAISGRGPRCTVTVPDFAIGALIGLSAVFLLVENPLFRADIPRGAELYAFRDAVFFMLMYYVGRATPQIAESDRLLKHAFSLALVISVIGIVERIFVTPEMLVLLGVASYLNDFLGLSSYTAGNEYGLPINYWTWMGGRAVQRAGSVFLHSQGFALPFLLLMPAATAFAFHAQRKRRTLVLIGYALIWTGLLLTITRMTIVLCVAQIALFFLARRRPEQALGTVTLAMVSVALTLIILPGGLLFVWETLTFQTGSSESHIRDWMAGINAFVQQPWGHGLGTTDAPPLRFLRFPITSDNMYLSYGVQLGVVGLITLLTIFATIGTRAWKMAWHGASDARRQFGTVLFLATVGILANGITSTVFSSNVLAYVFFWMAGALVTVSESALPSAARRPHLRPVWTT